MNFIQKRKLLKQFEGIRSVNVQFIEFVNTQLVSDHAYNEDEIRAYNTLIEHLTNIDLIFARMEDGVKQQKG